MSSKRLPAIDQALLAELLAADGFDLPQDPAQIGPRAPLVKVLATPAQERLWAIESIEGSSGAFNLGLEVRFNTTVDTAAMQRALLALVQRHESLQVRFSDQDNELQQLFDAPERFMLQCHETDCENAQAVMRRIAAQPFELAAGSLMRAHLIHAGTSQTVLLLCFHHAVIDLWSVAIVLQDLTALYALERGDGVAPLHPPEIQFGDYAMWLRAPERTHEQAAMRQYWAGRLAGLPVTFDLPFSAPRGQAGAESCERIPLTLGAPLSDAVSRFGLSYRATPFMVLLAGFAAVLARFSGAEDIAVGTPVSNRHRPRTRGIVGFLTDNLVLRTDLAGDPSFGALLARVRDACVEDFRNQDLSFDEVVKIVNPERRKAVMPLFQTMFIFQSMPSLRADAGGVSALAAPMPMPAARADLVLELAAGPEGIAGGLEYRHGLIDPQIAAGLAHAIVVLLETAIAEPDAALSMLPLQCADAARALLDARNPAPLPSGTTAPDTLTSWFVQRARLAPDEVALIDGRRQISYQELDQRSCALAAHLAGLGTKPDMPVAICLERSVDLAVAILAVLRAGAAFLPLDPGFPAERLNYMLRDSGAPILICEDHPAWLAAGLAPVLVAPSQARPQVPAPDDCNQPNSLAYVLYTSGSTGQPKAVMGLHLGAVNRIRWMLERYPFEPFERCCQKTNPTFVDFIWEFFGPLLAGIPSVILPRSVVIDPAAFVHALEHHRITRLVVVPSLLRSMIDHVAGIDRALQALRHCTCSGEALPSELASRFRALLPNCRLLNLYGSSEVSADSTFHEVSTVDENTVPIGRPIPGNTVTVLDRAGRAVPVGVAGEIVIGGVGLARGYWRRAGFTAERFMPLPAGRAFRSGDLGRWRPDGGLDYLGRLDRQVKIRGVRIDPGEIQSALTMHPAVSDAAVCGIKLNGDELTLVAYVVTSATLGEDSLRLWLAEKLPAAMQPAAYVFLAQLPLNANGKVDFLALPRPGEPSANVVRSEMPPTPLTLEESLLADIWQPMLGMRPHAPQANFFKLGGHSLSAVRLAAAIERSFGVRLPVAAIFDAPTLRAMAARVREAQPNAPCLPEFTASGPHHAARASFNQERLWLLEQPGMLQGAYNQPIAYRLQGNLDAGRFEQSLREVVQRHEALRTRLVMRQGQLWQQIDAQPAFCLRHLDLSHSRDAEAQARDFMQQEASRPFQLDSDLPLRATLITLVPQTWILLLVLHHSASDGWSGQLIVDDIKRCYAGHQAGALAPQQADYTDWQRACLEGGLFASQLEYWRNELKAAPATLDLAFCAMPQQRDYRLERVAVRLDSRQVERLQEIGQDRQVTLFSLLLGVWAVVLARFSAQEDLIVGIPVSGRSMPALDGVVGFLSNTIPLRVDCSEALGLDECARRVQLRVLNGLQNQDVSFAHILEVADVTRVENRQPLVQAMFTLADTGPWSLALDQVECGLMDVVSAVARADISLVLKQSGTASGNAIEGHLEYAADVLSAALAARIAEAFLRLLDAAIDQPATPLMEHPLVGAGERALLAGFAASSMAMPPASPSGMRIHALVRQSAAAHPNATAVMSPGGKISYLQLERLSDRFARRLRAAGVRPGDHVALIAERSIELIVALIGISKAGAAYVPIDPAYPAASIDGMLADAQVAAIVADRSMPATGVASLPMPSLDEDGDVEECAVLPACEPADGDAAACIIFTSGSSGRPKGVVVGHHALCRLALAARTEFAIGESSRILQLAAFGFDVATSDVVFAMAAAACLCIAPRDQLLPGSPLLRTLDVMSITHLQIPASLLAATPPAPLPHLATLIVGGERCPPKLAAQWAGGRHLFVAYGPTEATVTTTAGRYAGPDAPFDIGKPIGDARVYLLDSRGLPVPIGVPGELYIGGPAVSRGYLNNPALTAERFRPDPFDPQRDARLYRSGDRARWREDGALDFLGRIDRQFKLRGFRIEPGEIEAALLSQAGVEQALAMLRADAPGQTQLVGYVVSADAALDLSALRGHLRRTLPSHMVPAALVCLSRMPLTTHGKIDLKALPAPQPERHRAASRADAEDALDDIGRRVASLWRQALGLSEIDPNANFFDVGGHSLLLVQLHDALAAELGFTVPISDLFRFPTIRSLAGHLGGRRDATDALSFQPIAAGVDSSDDIAVIGMACRFPGAADLDAFWQLLAEGREGISRFDAGSLAAAGRAAGALQQTDFVAAGGIIDEADCFDAEFFGLGPRDALTLDPQHRVTLECAWHALEHAGYTPAAPNDSIGVFVGVGVNTYLRSVLFPTGQLPDGADAYHAMSGNDKDFAASRVAYHLDLKGPAMAVQTACSSSLVAVDLACQALKNGRARMALAGGVAIRFPQTGGYRHEAGMILSPDGHCRTFAADAAGTVPGSGVGMVLLKRLSAALADGDNVLAVIRGTAVNNDGALKVGYAAPGVDGQAEVIAGALHAARLQAGDIDYVEAHGTGTELGDPIELAALTRVFQGRSRPLALGSVKTNIGHADAAAGIAGLIKTVLALQHAVLPPSLHFSAPNPHVDFSSAKLKVIAEAQAWPQTGRVRRAGVSAFGIGGTNAHIVLEQAPPTPHATDEAAKPEVIVLSARSEAALKTSTLALVTVLERQPALPLSDVAFTLRTGRAAFAFRCALVAESRDSAITMLRQHAARDAWRQADRTEPKTAFLFPGQGSQYPGMARALYESDSVYRLWFDRCAVSLIPHLGADLRGLLYGDEASAADADALKQTRLAQPALFSVMYALAQSVMAQGVKPAAMLGHSLGEYVAACLAGVFELEDALGLVAARGRLMQSLDGGAMLAVQIGADEAERLLLAMPGCGLSLAAINASDQCVFAGPAAEVDALQERLQASNRVAVRLETSHAFHSSAMDAILPAFIAQCTALTLCPPKRRFLSNVTGTWITDAEATDPAYWARHLRLPVRYDDGLAALRDAGIGVLLELGPGGALQKLARSAGWKADHLPSLGLTSRVPERGCAVLEVLAHLWTIGARIDWQPAPAQRPQRRLALPGYPFERRRHWPAASSAPAAGPAMDKRPDMADWFYLPGWRRAAQIEAALASETWLLFSDAAGTGSALCKALRASHQHVIAVEPGAGFSARAPDHFTIHPDAAADYRRLLGELEQGRQRPTRIVHLWGALSGADPAQVLQHGFFSTMHLVQAIGAAGVIQPVRLDIVTRGVADITGAETLVPAAAPLLGAAKVIPLEYRNIDCRLIDLGPAVGPAVGPCPCSEESAWLVRELANSEKTALVALRSRHRWVPHLNPVRLDPPASESSRLRPQGTYLITGGFGGMGAAIARDLATRHRARLILVGRHIDRPLVEALEDAGAEVLPAACDIADERALAKLIAHVRQRFGQIHGVFHAAGVADLGGVIQNRDGPSLAAALAAKMQGSMALDRLLASDALDFMVLFSSLGSLLPEAKFGQVGYAAANEFLDLFALERTARTGQFTVAINWDDWAEVGMTVAAYRRWGKSPPTLRDAMSPDEGVEVLYRILAAPHNRIAVSIRDLLHLMAHAYQLLEGLASATSKDDDAGAKILTGHLTETEAILAVTWSQILGVADIAKEANFFELGGHSLIAMRLLSFVRKTFGAELSIAAIFEHATLEKLARHIDSMKPQGEQFEEFTV